MVFAQSAWELACLPAAGAEARRDGPAPRGQPERPARPAHPRRTAPRRRQAEGGDRRLQGRGEEQPPAREAAARCARSSTSPTPNCSATTSTRPKRSSRSTRRCANCPLDADEAPEEKVRRAGRDRAPQAARTCYLLARGREGQGRLGEAFDHYLALANLGEGKNLLEMPDEPNVRMRPDVWARGRIEAMIRRANDAAARKSLEDRVDKEWEAVKGGNDLKRLREFVAVFGPYFAAGARGAVHPRRQAARDQQRRRRPRGADSPAAAPRRPPTTRPSAPAPPRRWPG